MISTSVHTTPIPKDWQKLRIKDVSSVNSKSLGNDTNPYYQFKYVDIGNVNQNGIVNDPETIQFHEAPSRARRIIIEGDVIVSTVRTYLKAVAYFNFNPKDYIVSTGFAVLSHTKKINPAYLSYFCQSDFFIDSVIENSKGVSYPAINATELSCLSVYYPPFKEQTAIAKYLDTNTQAIDKKVSLLEKKIGYYQELRKSLIKEAVTKGLDKNVKLKDSGIDWIGQIPEHWEVKRFKSFASTSKGKNIETLDLPFDNALPLLSLEYLRNENVKFDTYAYSPDRNMLASEKDLIIVWDGAAVGEILKAKTGFISSTIAKINFTKSVSSRFFYFLKDSLEYTLKSIPTGMGIPHLNPTILSNYPCPIPPLHEQIEIAEYLENKVGLIEKIITNIQTQITTLKELRKTLINDVVTGKIKVSHE